MLEIVNTVVFLPVRLSPTITDRAARVETRYLDLECKCFVREEEGSARSLKATSFWLMGFEMALQEQ